MRPSFTQRHPAGDAAHAQDTEYVWPSHVTESIESHADAPRPVMCPLQVPPNPASGSGAIFPPHPATVPRPVATAPATATITATTTAPTAAAPRGTEGALGVDRMPNGSLVRVSRTYKAARSGPPGVLALTGAKPPNTLSCAMVRAGSASSPPLRVSFGKYELLASLGHGGMADVFLAAAGSSFGVKKLVVVKRPRTGVDEDSVMRQMFLDEARLAARLNHPNVVQTYEVGEHAGMPFLAMEFLEGQPLSRFLREITQLSANVPLPVMMRIASDALAGLHYAHELADYDGSKLSIVHRDVSPQNIFVGYDGQIKLVDFGVAKAAGNVSRTESGALKGKVAYMAPEQVREEPLDRRIDVYAMGVVCWEMITRRRLFTGASSAVVLDRVAKGKIPRLSAAVPGIAPLLDAIVHRALHKEPDKRFQSAQEMREALESYIAASGVVVLPDAIGETMTSLFAPVRAEVTAKVREYMTMEVAPSRDPMTDTMALARLELGGRAVPSGELPKPGEASVGSLAAGVGPVKSGAASRSGALPFALVASAGLVALGLAVGVGARHPARGAPRPRLELAARPHHEIASHDEERRAADAPPSPVAVTPAPRGRPTPAPPSSPSPPPSDPTRPRRPIDTTLQSD